LLCKQPDGIGRFMALYSKFYSKSDTGSVITVSIANTPKPPYYAVIFTSKLAGADKTYGAMADRMLELAAKQTGFLGFESARDELGISVSYWQDLPSIKAWKQNSEHLEAQRLGRNKWYSDFALRIALVERDYCL
jgi:heme-degrading monooxygenase HmoA